ncbi:MAG: DinB family protein [Thermoprotei archaeon]
MNSLDEIRDWYRYNFDVRKKYLATFESLGWSGINFDSGASFPTLASIMHHVFEAYHWWFNSFLKNDPGETNTMAAPKSVADLARSSESLEEMVFAYLNGLSEEDLHRVVTRSFQVSGRKHTLSLPVKIVLWHMVEEELQHRGEMNAILWQKDVDPPVTGYDDWYAEKTNMPPF